MINAKDAKAQSLLKRETLVANNLIFTLEDIMNHIQSAIDKGETYIYVNTSDWMYGLDEAITEKLREANYHVTVKLNSLGISWTNA